MNIKKQFFFVVCVLSICGLMGAKVTSMAQILDDTTQQIYGPSTTQYILENYILDDLEVETYVDSSILNFHRFNFIQKNDNLYQDLGIMGTALRPVFFQLPSNIGARLGIDPYQPMFYDPQTVKYYNTKSPFTQANYVQGVNSEQKLNFLYTRNINPRWNVGFEYGRITSNRQFGTAFSEDRMGDAIKFLLFTSYSSENGKYQLLYHFAHLNLSMSETGGVLPNELLPNNGFFSFRDADALLGRSASSRQSKSNHYVLQQYELDEAFTVFQRFEIQRQLDAFEERDLAANADNYPKAQPDLIGITQTGELVNIPVFNFNNQQTSEQTIYNVVENTLGIKGKLAKFNYRLYLKNRLYRWNTSYENRLLRVLNPDSTTASQRRIEKRLLGGLDNLVGGTLFFQFSDSTRLEADAEILIGDNYRIGGFFKSKNFEATFTSMLYAPSLFEQRFVSNHFQWDNGFDFSNTLVNRATGSITLTTRNRKLRFQPQGSYTVINNLVYLDTLARPRQSSEFIQLLQIGFAFDVQFGRWHSRNLAFATANTGTDFLRIPELFLTTQLYCENCLLKKYLKTQIGIDVHYKSGYFADAYMPITKQFHLQDNFFVGGYAMIDLFMNVRIKNVRLFLKLIHANQLPDEGYIPTPIYPAPPRTFTFGVDWMFFK